jgi:hypothetical protein
MTSSNGRVTSGNGSVTSEVVTPLFQALLQFLQALGDHLATGKAGHRRLSLQR